MDALVTGSSGFIGRHMVAELEARDWNVFCLDTAEEDGVDAVDYFRRNDADYFDLVVHCAYTVGGRATIDGVNLALADNVMLDAAMFRWALQARPGAVIYYSSSAAYPVDLQREDRHKNLQEDDLQVELAQPDANYGWAKVTGERLARAASESGLRVHVLRPFSGYGEDQSLDYPFPSIIQRALAGDLTVWGPPGQTRDWIHIEDVVQASLAVYEDNERQPVNLCTGRGVEMGELMRRVLEELNGCDDQCGCDQPEVTYLLDKPTGVFYRVGDPTLMNKHYTAKISLEEGIRRALKAPEAA